MVSKGGLSKKETVNYRKYHIPGCSPMHGLKIDACFFSAANSLEHELEKARLCIMLKKRNHHFLTEAERNRKDEHGRIRRVDVVDLVTGLEYEIETTPERAIRFWNDDIVEVVPVGWSIHDEKWRKLVEKLTRSD